MKTKHTFTPPHKILFLIGFTSIALFSGCSSNHNVTQSTDMTQNSTQQAESVSETQAPEQFSFNTEGELWDYLESVYPIVTANDVGSGNYTGQYVIVDSVARNVTVSSYDYVSCDMYFPSSNGDVTSKHWACFFGNDDLKEYGCISGQQYLANMQDDQSFRVCYRVNSDNSFGPMNMLAIKLLEDPAINTPENSNSADSTGGRLENATIFTADIFNGSGTEVIGQRAYIILPKSALKEITESEYSVFLDSKVKDSGYNWFSIICDDGTGIVFNGCFTGVGTYGNMDQEGAVVEAIGYITLTENGYIYELAQ